MGWPYLLWAIMGILQLPQKPKGGKGSWPLLPTNSGTVPMLEGYQANPLTCQIQAVETSVNFSATFAPHFQHRLFFVCSLPPPCGTGSPAICYSVPNWRVRRGGSGKFNLASWNQKWIVKSWSSPFRINEKSEKIGSWIRKPNTLGGTVTIEEVWETVVNIFQSNSHGQHCTKHLFSLLPLP